MRSRQRSAALHTLYCSLHCRVSDSTTMYCNVPLLYRRYVRLAGLLFDRINLETLGEVRGCALGDLTALLGERLCITSFVVVLVSVGCVRSVCAG